jgi:preprotein translocase subunit SecY
MKRFITTLNNIWNIEELRKRILLTLGLLAVYRFGAFVVLPGVDASRIQATDPAEGAKDLLDLINTFTGGAFNSASIFALGIMPYITASIIIQLLGFAVPYFQRLQKDGETGRKKLTQITRALTLAITFVQGTAYLQKVIGDGLVMDGISLSLFTICNLIVLSAGTIFAMWLGERITDRGVGNGVSLLITIGIIASLPQSFAAELGAQSGTFLILILELAALFGIIMVTVLIVQGVRRIPVQYAKQVSGRGSNIAGMKMQNERDFIPLKVNAAGVMPIIFAQAILFLPATVGQYFLANGGEAGSLYQQLVNPFSVLSSALAFILVVGFTYIYTALMVNPKEYANYLKNMNAFIPGVKPGQPTADLIDTITSRITLPGSVFLGIIAILPAFAVAAGVNQGFAIFFGGTSLLILVAVVLDTLAQIESYLLLKHYDGLMKSGRIQGKQSRMNNIGAQM